MYSVRQAHMQAGEMPVALIFQGKDLLFYLQCHWEIILEYVMFDVLKDVS